MKNKISKIPVNCPSCNDEIIQDIFSVSLEISDLKCESCNEVFISKEGSFKFLTYDSPEEEYYEEKYDLKNITKKQLSFST